MIVDFFYALVNVLTALIPDVPEPPDWWPTTGISIPLQGIASASVVGGVLLTYLAVLVLSTGVMAARRVISLVSLGGGSL